MKVTIEIIDEIIEKGVISSSNSISLGEIGIRVDITGDAWISAYDIEVKIDAGLDMIRYIKHGINEKASNMIKSKIRQVLGIEL